MASAEKRELKAEGVTRAVGCTTLLFARCASSRLLFVTRLPSGAKEKGEWYKGAEKLKDKVALITGGSHGIGRSVAVFFAKEGCDVAISYRASKEDAELTKKWVEEAGRRCLLLQGDIRDKAVCRSLVEKTVAAFGKLNILVNNAAVQHWHEKFEELTPDIVADTFDNNGVFLDFTRCSSQPSAPFPRSSRAGLLPARLPARLHACSRACSGVALRGDARGAGAPAEARGLDHHQHHQRGRLPRHGQPRRLRSD